MILKAMESVSSVTLVFLAVLCCLIGAFLVYGSIAIFIKDIQRGKWPEVEATIIKVDLQSGKLKDSGSNNRLAGFEWRLKVNYQYQVDGENFDGSRYSNVGDDLVQNMSGGEAIPELWTEEIKQAMHVLKEGHQVKVRFNPSSPNESFVFYKSGLRNALYFGIFGILAFLAPGVLFTWVLLQRSNA